MQPTIRTKPTHDPSSMEGQAYVPEVLFFELQKTSGSGAVNFWWAPPGTLVHEIQTVVSVAFADGTLDIGDEDADDTFIANSEVDLTAAGDIASSRETQEPAGKYFVAGQSLKATFGGSSDADGQVQLLLTVFHLADMENFGFHDSVEP